MKGVIKNGGKRYIKELKDYKNIKNVKRYVKDLYKRVSVKLYRIIDRFENIAVGKKVGQQRRSGSSGFYKKDGSGYRERMGAIVKRGEQPKRIEYKRANKLDERVAGFEGKIGKDVEKSHQRLKKGNETRQKGNERGKKAE